MPKSRIAREIDEILSSGTPEAWHSSRKTPKHHATRSNLKLTDNQKTMLRIVADTGRMSSGRYGWNEMHVRALEKKGLVQLVSKATWDKEWKLTDLGREVAKALHAEWLSQVK